MPNKGTVIIIASTTLALLALVDGQQLIGRRQC